jgi:L-asparaginase type I
MIVRHNKRKGASMKEAVRAELHRHPDDHECTVGLVLTGGTIGSQEDNEIVSLRDGQVEADLVASAWPGQTKPNIEVRSPLRQLSENLSPDDWVSIAHDVRELVEVEQVAGVVILHGTDTMAYTAAALSFLLSDIDKPIVLTGSNLPTRQIGSDAVRNVQDAGIAIRELGPGTYIAFAGGCDLRGFVYLGTRARKLRPEERAFISVNRDPVARIVDGSFIEEEPYHAPPHQRFKCAVDKRVLALRLYPGLDLELISDAVVQGDIRGVVLELYASATGPIVDNHFSVPHFITKCAENGIVVTTAVAVTPKTNGNTYETTLAIEQAGGLFLHDMLPETATVKLMWALAQSDDVKYIEQLMLTPIAGEIEAESGTRAVDKPR